MEKFRLFLHKKFNIHWWKDITKNLPCRKCKICGKKEVDGLGLGIWDDVTGCPTIGLEP